MSKKDDPWHLEDTSGSLFCMPNNEEFEMAFPTANPPYVFMQPVDDRKSGHDLIEAMLKHKVAAILLSECPVQLEDLMRDFALMRVDLEHWAWSKTSNMDHFSKTKEEQNQTFYFPSEQHTTTTGQLCTTARLYGSFVTNLNCEEGLEATSSVDRLSVFHGLMDGTGSFDDDDLPRIKHAKASQQAYNEDIFNLSNHPKSLSEATWRELLLGEGDGSWKRTIEAEMEKQRKNGARSSAVSPVMNQNSYSR
jgi:hypothetical protein